MGHRSLNSFSFFFYLSFSFCFINFQIPILIFISEISAWRLVFWNTIHMEVASDSFCFLVYSSWLLVSIAGKDFTSHRIIFLSLSLLLLGLSLVFIFIFLLFLLFLVSEGLLFVSFFWTSFHSLCSPTLEICFGEGFYLPDPCELTFANTLLLTNAAISLGNAFVSLEISLQFLIFFSLFSFILAWTFVSLQIKEFSHG